jgi:hypothetical protein
VPIADRATAWRIGILAVAVFCSFPAHLRGRTFDEAQPATATVAGIVVDDTGAPIAAATIALTLDGGAHLETTTGADGRFAVIAVAAGPFQLTAAAPGFARQILSGVAAPGQVTNLPEIRLRVSLNAVAVEVSPSVVEIAEQQIKEEQQQRVLGLVPNFFVSFHPDAAPLNAHQKFQLSWKAHIDPMQFAFVGIFAGVQQWRGDYPGFGSGASGYAKRYAAGSATVWTDNMITQVLLPIVLRQDPRYFYKGTGTTRARLAYAVSRSIIRKGDNGRWQPNYSGIVGSFASGAISNFYYPAEDRRGARLMLQNTAVGIAGGAVGKIAQEFLYARITSRGRR